MFFEFEMKQVTNKIQIKYLEVLKQEAKYG